MLPSAIDALPDLDGLKKLISIVIDRLSKGASLIATEVDAVSGRK